MIDRKELKKISKARLRDAEVLSVGNRYDGAVYICGYAVEIALKEKICKTLKWVGFPETGVEFKPLRSFKTHNLDVLLSLSGAEEKIKTKYFTEWSTVALWDSEVRYRSIGTATENEAKDIIKAARSLMKIL